MMQGQRYPWLEAVTTRPAHRSDQWD